MKVCGVVVAMVQGHSWVPIPSKGSRMNVGTVPAFPDRNAAAGGVLVGWTHGLSIRPGRGGGPVLRGRESGHLGKGPSRIAVTLTGKETHW